MGTDKNNNTTAFTSLKMAKNPGKHSMEEIKLQENKLRSELRGLTVRLVEHTREEMEHNSVLSVLRIQPENKRAYRMIGDVLTESTVKEVIPSLEQRLAMNKEIANQYVARKKEKEAELRAFMQKYGIMSDTDRYAADEKERSEKKEQLKSTGILA